MNIAKTTNLAGIMIFPLNEFCRILPKNMVMIIGNKISPTWPVRIKSSMTISIDNQ